MKQENYIIQNCKDAIIERIKTELENIENEKEIYFHDIISEEVDIFTPQNREEQLKLIDKADTHYFDDGLIDKSSVERMLLTSAYCSLEQNIFNDNLIQELQDKLNNETINEETAKEILKLIYKEGYEKTKVIYTDNATQIFINLKFDYDNDKLLSKCKIFFNEKQIINLYDGVKILTSNKSMNQNAIVIQKKKKDLIRVYLMEKDKDIDIRNFFKLKSISEETGFNLSPSAYIERDSKTYDKEQEQGIKQYQHQFKDLDSFIIFIRDMAYKLTERTL